MASHEHSKIDSASDCAVRKPERRSRKERGVLWVILLTFVMMVVEIIVGYSTHSMALLADGWHMATHVGALGITSVSYVVARRHSTNRAFTFGTGKVHALGGFISALALGAVAVTVVIESITRLFSPETIHYSVSIPVAVIGLVVNLLSVGLLHDRNPGHEHEHAGHEHEHAGHEHEHADHEHEHADHGHQAALIHVMADALTSAFAIVALSLGKWANLGWMDPVTGLVGALIIFKWGISLGRTTAFELLDFAPTSKYEDEIYAFVSKNPNLSILDLHVWCIGRGKMSCILTLQAAVPYDLGVLRSDILTRFQLAHLTIELRQATVKEPKLEPNKT